MICVQSKQCNFFQLESIKEIDAPIIQLKLLLVNRLWIILMNLNLCIVDMFLSNIFDKSSLNSPWYDLMWSLNLPQDNCFLFLINKRLYNYGNKRCQLH